MRSTQMAFISSLRLRDLCLVSFFIAGFSQEVTACGGDLKLCEKRYNEVTFPTSHNAQSYLPTINFLRSDYLLPFQWQKEVAPHFSINVNNQDLSLKLQLYSGIRAMKLRIMPV